jgi:hypothetical protein
VVLDAITQVGEQLDPTAVQVAQALLKVGEVHADSASSQSNAISVRCALCKNIRKIFPFFLKKG